MIQVVDVFRLLPWKLLPRRMPLFMRHLGVLLSIIEHLLVLWTAALPFHDFAMRLVP